MRFTTATGRNLELSKLSMRGLLEVTEELKTVHLDQGETAEFMASALQSVLSGVTDGEERRRLMADFVATTADTAAVLSIMRQSSSALRVIVCRVAGLRPDEVDALDVSDVLGIVLEWLAKLGGVEVVRCAIELNEHLAEVLMKFTAATAE